MKPHRAAHLLLSSGKGWSNGKAKVRKPVGWDKDSLKVKAKAMHMQAEEEKELIPCFPWSERRSAMSRRAGLCTTPNHSPSSASIRKLN